MGSDGLEDGGASMAPPNSCLKSEQTDLTTHRSNLDSKERSKPSPSGNLSDEELDKDPIDPYPCPPSPLPTETEYGSDSDGSGFRLSSDAGRVDYFSAAENGFGRKNPYSIVEIQEFLDNGFLRDFLDAYCSNMGIELIRGEWRATVIYKRWASNKDLFFPVIIIDGPGSVNARDLQMDPDAPRILSLPIQIRCMPGLGTKIEFDAAGDHWMARDISNRGEVWELDSSSASLGSDSLCYFYVQFGDCGRLTTVFRSA
ncbi:hypothetical protein T439DRAFT_205350 [Meredithblackwellia eburnea MCA 4105]